MWGRGLVENVIWEEGLAENRRMEEGGLKLLKKRHIMIFERSPYPSFLDHTSWLDFSNLPEMQGVEVKRLKVGSYHLHWKVFEGRCHLANTLNHLIVWRETNEDQVRRHRHLKE